MEIHVIKKPIRKERLGELAQWGFGDFIKAVVDIEQGIMALGGEFHSEEEVLLMEQEHSQREHTWGVNLHPNEEGDGFFEFDSMINLKPAYGNRSRSVEDEEIKKKITNIVKNLIHD